MEALIDVVIGTAGRFDMLDKCLNALYREAQTHPINLYLIDNGSPMQEKVVNQYLFAYSPGKDEKGNVNWNTRRLPENMGFPYSANEGARMGKAPLIMFLSDDVELQSGALDRIIRDMDDPHVGVVGIKTIFPPDSTAAGRPAGMVQHVGIALNIHADPIHPLIGWNPAHPKCNITRKDAFAVTGACFTIRRSLFEKAGMFNMVFGKGTYEDVDMCCRVRSMGAQIMIDTEALAYHYVGATMEKRQEPFALAENNARWKTAWLNAPGILQWDEYKYW